MLLVVLACLAPRRCDAAIPSPLVDQPWVRVKTDHFVVLGNIDRMQAVEIARRLERLSETLQRIEPELTAVGVERMRVYAFDGDGTFKYFSLHGVESLTGYCLSDGGGSSLVLNVRSDEDPHGPLTMYHEFTHAYLHRNFEHVPLWLDEGLAQYYSTFVPGDREAEIGHPIASRAAWCGDHALYSLEALFDIRQESPQYRLGDDRTTFYSESYALVAFLWERSSRDSNSFTRYLGLLRHGEDPVRAFASVYPRDTWPALLAELRHYIGRGEFTYWKYRFASGFDAAQVETHPMSREDVLSDVGDLLLARTESGEPDLDRAAEFYSAVLRAQPDHTHALAGLGYVNELRGQPAAAESLYNRAYVADSEDPRSCLLGGRGALHRLQVLTAKPYQDASRKALLRAIRTRFACCLANDPSNTEALIGYGKSYVLDSGPPDPPAIAALMRAFHARGDRVDLLWDLLDLMVRSGQERSADSLLQSMRERVPVERLESWQRDHAQTQEFDTLNRGNRELAAENYAAALALFERVRNSDNAEVRARAAHFILKTRTRMRLAEAAALLRNRGPERAKSLLDSLVTAHRDSSDANALQQELAYARQLRDEAGFRLETDHAVEQAKGGRLQAARAAFTRALEFAHSDDQRTYVHQQLERLQRIGGPAVGSH